MDRYLVHAVGMFEEFKHYHISFLVDGLDVNTRWVALAKDLIHCRIGKCPMDTYIVGFVKL